MGKSLVIVESPAKATTINKILGNDFVVKSCMGHVRDLPPKELGVDIEKDFKPRYVTIRGKGKILAELKRAAATADTIYLATDPDREGEAIAWHVAEAISPKGAVVKRILFNEITPKAVLESIGKSGTLDINKVNAQQARRVLDRLVGSLQELCLTNFEDSGCGSSLTSARIGKSVCASRGLAVAHFLVANSQVDRDREVAAALDFVREHLLTDREGGAR